MKDSAVEPTGRNPLLPKLAGHWGDVIFGFGTLLTSLVALIGSIIAARYLTPQEMGIMQTLALIPIYGAFLHGGVFNGANRNIALFLGKGDHTKVQGIVDSSWKIAKLMCGLGTLVCCAGALYYWMSGAHLLYSIGLLFVFVLLVTEPLSAHLELVYMSNRRFQSLGLRLIVQNIITLFVNLLPAVLGVAGFVASRCIYGLTRLGLRYSQCPIPARGPGSWTEVQELAKTGLPLLVAGALYGLLNVADRSVVAFCLGDREVGFYSLAGMILAGIQFVPTCVATVFYPRIVAAYAKHEDASALRHYFWLLLLTNIVLVVPICLVGFLCLDSLVVRWLPAYTEGLPAAKLTCLSSIAAVYIGCGAILAATRRNTPYLIALGAGLVAVWILGIYAVRHGFGILGVAYIRAAATVLAGLFTLWFTFRVTSKRPAVSGGVL